MAQALLLSATAADDHTPEHRAPLLDLRRSAEVDRFGIHSLTDDPLAADVIMFVESYGAGWHFERVRSHPLTGRYREKCFVFCSNPYVIPFLPGIYTGVDRRWASARTITGFYVGLDKNTFITFTPPTADLPYLFSFMGSTATAPVRQKLAHLARPRALFHDTTAMWERLLSRQIQPDEREAYYRRYTDATKMSKFVLCPRGLSASTIRVFETMRMGRVPVILSDAWVEPPGPVWEKFAIRMPESAYADIPRLLEEREHEAVAMGELARQEWLDWFSDEAKFHRTVEWCLAIKSHRRVPESLARWPVYLQYLRPFHFRRALGLKYRALRESRSRAAAVQRERRTAQQARPHSPAEK